MYKSLIFDLDGTLLNTEQALFKALRKTVIDEQGHDIRY